MTLDRSTWTFSLCLGHYSFKEKQVRNNLDEANPDSKTFGNSVV